MPRSAHKLVFALTIVTLIVGKIYLTHPQIALAADGINKQINFQGKVVNSNGTNVTDGSYDFTFKIYSTSSGGSPIWTETRTGGNQVPVSAGIFRVSLGSVNALPGSVNFNSDSLYLGIEFNGDGEMTPRVRFAAVPYAFNAAQVNGLTVTNTSGNPFSTATTFQIADGKTFVVNNGLTFSGTDSTTFTFPSSSGNVVTESFAQTLTNKTIGSTGLTFSGANIDITTGSNEILDLVPNGNGNVLINPIAGGQAALIIDKLGNNDIFSASASGATRFTINNAGAIGLTGGYGIATQCLISNGSGAAASWGSCGAGGGGTNYWQLNGPVLSPGNQTVDFVIGDTSTASAKFAVLGVATNSPTASISGTTGNGITLGSNGSIQSLRNNGLTIGGDTTGTITFLPSNGTGGVVVGSTNNGLTFNVTNNDNRLYSGSARPTKTINLSPEYAGATLTTDGSSNTNGSMTADNTLNSGGVGWKNYYQWTSTQGTLQDYTVSVRITLPQDFDSWQTGSCGGSSCALEIAYQTGVSGTTDNAVSVQVNNAENTPGSVICTIAAASSTSWSSFGCTSTDLATSPTWNTAGDVAILRIKLAADSTSSALARIGDITLRYYAKY